MSQIINQVKQDLDLRELKGIETYGTTMDRGDLSQGEWLNHLYEELLDSVLYIKKLQNEIAREAKKDERRRAENVGEGSDEQSGAEVFIS